LPGAEAHARLKLYRPLSFCREPDRFDVNRRIAQALHFSGAAFLRRRISQAPHLPGLEIQFIAERGFSSHQRLTYACLRRVSIDAIRTTRDHFDLGQSGAIIVGTTMARATMFRDALEQYLLGKANDFISQNIVAVRVARLTDTAAGCNWVLAAVEPPLSVVEAESLNDLVIIPARDAINLED
jgi:hypothetical protein